MKGTVKEVIVTTSTRYVFERPVMMAHYLTDEPMLVDVVRVVIAEDDAVEVGVHDTRKSAGTWDLITDADEDELLELLGIEVEAREEPGTPAKIAKEA